MHTSSLAPQMETSLESKFSAAFEQQIQTGGSSSSSSSIMRNPLLCNGSNRLVPKLPSQLSATAVPSGRDTTTTASSITTSTTESSGEKTVSFRKGNDLDSFESLSWLFANGLFTDLVICCPGKMFKCHRVVMAAASLYIRDALSAFYNNNTPDSNGTGNGGTNASSGGPTGGGCNNCNTVMILPTEIKSTDMEAILRFIYDGHVEVKVDCIESFLRSARLLNIKGLANVNIVFNNNGTTTATSGGDDSTSHDGIEVSASAIGNHPLVAKNGHHGYNHNHSSKNVPSATANNNQLLNGHAGMNSPPPSPPTLNSSLASLKAMTANANSSPAAAAAAAALSALTNGHHNSHHLTNKFLNGTLTNHLINQYRNLKHQQQQSHHQRDQSPLRQESSSTTSSLLGATVGTNITPAHQSSTPKSIYNNGGNLFNNNSVRFDSSNSSVSSSGGGSRRKQKFPTNIPLLPDMGLPPSVTTALYNTWLSSMNSEEDEEDDMDDDGDEKRLVIRDDSSNDCGSTIGDNMSTTSIESKQPSGMPAFSVVPAFAPQVPCMIEVEADPTTFPTYADFNESSSSQQSNNHNKRKRNFKSPFDSSSSRINDKRLKLPFAGSAANSNNNNQNSLDVSIKPSSPLMHNSSQQQSTQSSPSDLVTSGKRNHHSTSVHRSSSSGSLIADKPLFTAYPAIKTAAGANPSGGSSTPTSGAAAGGSPSASAASPSAGSWVGSKWKCEICNKYYGNKQTLKEHMDYFHSNREEQIYICNICNKEYTWRKSLMKHYRDIHQMRNTPQLAEINRQLAQYASSKVKPPMTNIGPMGPSADPLQSFVSIANFSNRKPGQSKGSSDNSEKSNKSESEIDPNDNTNDAVTGEDMEDYGNDDMEMDGSCATDQEGPEDMTNDEHQQITNKSSSASDLSTTPEKPTTNGNKTENGETSTVDQTEPASNNKSNNIEPAPNSSPDSSQASS